MARAKLVLSILLIPFVNCIPLPKISPTTAVGTHAGHGPFLSGQLIFEDKFDKLDFEKWQHEKTLAGGGNWEFQWYTNNRTNSYAVNGKLHIVPTLSADDFGEQFLRGGNLNLHGGGIADQCTNPAFYGCERQGTQENVLNPVKSARLRTVNSFAFKYGTLEIRAKMPYGDWLWPAIWLMPRSDAYGTWPSSGEIDLIETRGNRNLWNPKGIHVGVEQMESTLHFGPRPGLNGYSYTNFKRNSQPGFAEDFHTYKLIWTPQMMTFKVDDNTVGSVNSTADGGFWKRGRFDEREPDQSNPWRYGTLMAPFDQEFYVIINLAVGSVIYFGDDLINKPTQKPWSNDSPHAMTEFWDGKDGWIDTWNHGINDDSHLQVDYIRIYAI